MFDVVVEFFVGIGCLPFKKVSRSNGFGGAGFQHDGEGLLEGCHQVFSHTV